MDFNENRRMRLEQAEQLLATSLTVKEWCRLNKVAESTMYKWLRVLREQEGAPRANGWIEVDREAAKEATALAVAGRPPAGTGTSAPRGAKPAPDAHGGPTAFPPIRVSANGVGIEVPHGACESDVAAVMRAAMSL